MKIQERVTAKRNARLLGKTLTVLVEGYERAAGCFFGRSYAESPDIDGKVFIYKPEKNRPSEGDFVEVRICEDIDGDLVGELAASDPA